MLGLGSAVLFSSTVWSYGWGVLNFPSYDHSAKESVSKYRSVQNSTLGYIYGMQPDSFDMAVQKSIFRKQLIAWDAQADFQTERGTLQLLWGKIGQADPDQGWPVIHPEPTLAELQIIFAMSPD